MESAPILASRFRPLVLAALLLGFLALSVGPARDAQARSGDQWRRCQQVLVNFQPEGEGGAIAIRARNVGCSRSRSVVRLCIKGTLARGWSGNYARNRFYLRRGRRLIVYKPVGGGGCLPVRSAGLDQSGDFRVAAAASLNRMRIYRVNLDGDRLKELVVAYNRPSGAMPVSWFDVRDRRSGRWQLVQRVRVTRSPGAASSGFRNAWVGDLNRDGRVEIAVRDFITPSAGEVLSIFRRGRGSIRFSILGRTDGDRVGVFRRHGRTAVFTVFRSSGHSPDGREHHERWSWARRFDSWVCTSDCSRL